MLKIQRRDEVIYEKEKRHIADSVNNNNHSCNNFGCSSNSYNKQK